MNDDLISRQAVTDLIMENDPWWCEGMTRTIFDGINRLPAVDAVPVRHGKWIKEFENEDGRNLRCSECRMVFYVGKGRDGNYCPNCGARMDGDRKE